MPEGGVEPAWSGFQGFAFITDFAPLAAGSALAVFDPHGPVEREAAVAPCEEIAHGLLADETPIHEHPQDLGLEEAFEVAGVEAWQAAEASIGAEATVGHEDMDMGMEVEQLAGGLEKAHGAGGHLSAVEGEVEVELESPPGAGGEPTEQLAVVAEEDAQALGDGEDHLAVSDVLKQFYDPVEEVYPRVTGDGRILYCARRELRLMEIDGTDSQTLSTLEGRYIMPALSPDGSWVVIPKAPGLWRLPLDGGQPTQLTDLEAYLPAISPDGSRLAFYFEEGGREWIGVMPIEGGDLEVALEGPALLSTNSSFLRWAEDGEALIINTAPGDRGNLWRLPLDGGELQRLTNFTDERLFWFEYSPDGENLLVSSGEYLRDAMLIRDFR